MSRRQGTLGDAAREHRPPVWPALSEAGIISSIPAAIESPGAIATKASKSMMIRKDRLFQAVHQPTRGEVICGYLVMQRCNPTEAGQHPLVAGFGSKERPPN